MSRPVVTAQCVHCKARRDIEAFEVPPGEMPMCERCHSPMVAVSAELKPKLATWAFRDGDRYLPILREVVGSPDSRYRTYCVGVGNVTDRFGDAVSEGFVLRESDDFNIGVVRDAHLIALLWMTDVVDDDPDLLERIASEIALDKRIAR